MAMASGPFAGIFAARPFSDAINRAKERVTSLHADRACEFDAVRCQQTMRIESFSANFDREIFTMLMERASMKWPRVLTPARVKEMTEFCLSLQHNEEKPLSFAVQHAGETTSFGICAFMDDIDFPDVEFFSFPEIIATLEREHERICEELEI